MSIARGNVAFVAVKEIGELDEKGKKVLSIVYGGRVPAPEDQPLALAEWFLEELMPRCRYSSAAAAKADLAKFKAFVKNIKHKDGT